MGFLDLFKSKSEPIRVNENKQALELRQHQYKLFEDFIHGKQANTAFKYYAIQLCINRIANALVKSDFLTFDHGKAKQGKVWYQLNVEPNQNQNAADFWNKVVYQMVMNEDGALVIQSKISGELLVADAYTLKEYAFKPNVYKHIMISNYMLRESYLEKDVFHFKLNNSKVKRIFDDIYREYGTFLGGAIRNYNRSNALKFALQIDTTFDQYKQKKITDENGQPVIKDGIEQTEYDFIIDDMFENRLKPIFEEKDSVTPIEAGLELNDLNAAGNSKTSGSAANKTTRDIAAMVDDIVNMAADAFAIPRGLLKGDTADADSMTDNFISFCINPLAEQIADEINRKLYGRNQVLKHTYCKVKTDHIRNYDITKLATSAELLSRIGAWSLNDILRYLDQEPLDEDWADKHIMSKNYALIEDALKGGEVDDDKNAE
ncbi:phage portal protein [Loigolactobacillus rennini]|uniref:Phage portal protein, HK97 family n=1 Tax=Loigolactobacillus rennini DSM 20253 TaxID=1423796 RepID=A0A0R2D4F0_9LACO|nr:phage portal protein [Loigolactobacillus rennini]KRM98769.1 phage portal protein, HK97 family [Loigolactobacillus rennini DSM 20253]